MARRYYSSTAVATTLSSSASNSDTSIDVTALSGYPVSTPWTAIIDPDTASEEVVEVTNVSGTTLTVTRGVDGTSGVSHSAGAVFRHGVSGRDFDEANSHVNDNSTDVHSQYITKGLISASKGALITSSGSAVDDLAVGTDGQVLTADSGETLGLKWADASGGKILQVIQGTDATSTSAGASYADTGLSASITPSSASSKVLILVNLSYRITMTSPSYSPGVYTQLLRDSTVIAGNALDMYITNAANAIYWYDTQAYVYLDSPNTTSSVTYKTQQKLYNGSANNIGERNTIILLEVGP